MPLQLELSESIHRQAIGTAPTLPRRRRPSGILATLAEQLRKS